MISRASAPELRVDLYADRTRQLYVYHQGLFVGDLVLLGFGNELHLVPLAGGTSRAVALSSYFVSLHRQADSVYVVSGEDITRLNLEGQVVWTSPQLAVDGIRLELIGEELISGEAEHDSPGDWRPFRIRVADGRPV